jgi:hypothetical protein
MFSGRGDEKFVDGLGYIHGTTFRRRMLTCPAYRPDDKKKRFRAHIVIAVLDQRPSWHYLYTVSEDNPFFQIRKP